MKMSIAENSKAARPPGPSLGLAIALIIAGIAIAIPTFIAGVVPIVRTVEATVRFDAPNTVRVHLGKATYMVYEDTGRSSIGSPFSSPGRVTLTPGDVTVSAADRTNVEVYDRGTIRETLSSRGDRFVGAARFTTPASGDYAISVRSTTRKAILIARPLSATVGSVLGWFALTGLGGIVLFVGVVLLIVEIKVASHGLLAAGGVISLILGSVILFQGEGVRVSWSIIAGATITTTAFFLFVIGAGMRAQRRAVRTGWKGLVGARAVVVERLGPRGRVRVAGELWDAESGASVEVGTDVIIVGVDRLKLRVRPAAKEELT